MLKYQLEYIKARLGERGQGVVEYALILAFVVGLAIVALSSDDEGSIGQKIKELFTDTGSQIDTAKQQVAPAGE